jgi:hypothetical protein
VHARGQHDHKLERARRKEAGDEGVLDRSLVVVVVCDEAENGKQLYMYTVNITHTHIRTAGRNDHGWGWTLFA